jgi:alginate O-acetyltransferase complex protein AlgJ
MAENDQTSRIADREAEALAEIAATRVSRRPAWSACLFFVFVLLLGAASELVPLEGRQVSPRTRGPIVPISWGHITYSWRVAGFKGVQYRIRLLLTSVRERAERDSAFSRLVRPHLQSFFLHELRYGNSQVLPGERDWLFYKHPFDQVVAPPFLAPEVLERRARPGWTRYPARSPDPVPGLLRLGRALERRGARLVFLPIPEKEQVYPERLRPRPWREAPVNPDFDELVAKLEAGGVAVFDAPRRLFRAARSRDDLWATQDTHWTPAGMELTAAAVAEFLSQRFGTLPGEPVRFGSRPIRHRLRGDLLGMLGLAAGDRPPNGFQFDATEVLGPDGRPYLAAATAAPILLLGDSFSLVFQVKEDGTSGAGLAEHLALRTGRRVSQLASPLETELDDRISLLRRHPAVLKAARLVIYEVATRGLGTYDWKSAGLGPPAGRHRRPAPSRASP